MKERRRIHTDQRKAVAGSEVARPEERVGDGVEIEVGSRLAAVAPVDLRGRKANLAGTERKDGHTTTASAHVRSRSDDFGRSGYSTIPPAAFLTLLLS
ncbi:hypothetical protein U1Q18_022915 [Sarracenia purpurea var. burkii]